MEIEIHIGATVYAVKIKAILFEDGLKFKSELKGTTMSTFNHRREYMASTIEGSINMITEELVRAWEELMNV